MALSRITYPEKKLASNAQFARITNFKCFLVRQCQMWFARNAESVLFALKSCCSLVQEHQTQFVGIAVQAQDVGKKTVLKVKNISIPRWCQ